jgi:uncharacterized membrane protein
MLFIAFQEKANLDASIKKNTAFIKKLKNISEEQKNSLCKELVSLKLSKYVSEVVTSIVECRLKTAGDIAAAAEVILHIVFFIIPKFQLRFAPYCTKDLANLLKCWTKT